MIRLHRVAFLIAAMFLLGSALTEMGSSACGQGFDGKWGSIPNSRERDLGVGDCLDGNGRCLFN
jgi:hypothetical protein